MRSPCARQLLDVNPGLHSAHCFPCVRSDCLADGDDPGARARGPSKRGHSGSTPLRLFEGRKCDQAPPHKLPRLSAAVTLLCRYSHSCLEYCRCTRATVVRAVSAHPGAQIGEQNWRWRTGLCRARGMDKTGVPPLGRTRPVHPLSALSMCTIPPDPDVSGIGVRAAVYIQAVVSALQFALVPLLLRGFRTGRHVQQAKELHGRGRASMGALLITSMALLISASVNVEAAQFSRYHAVIVLNLSWILGLCAVSNTLVLLWLERAVPRLDREAKGAVNQFSGLPPHADIDPKWVPFWATFERFAIALCFGTLGFVGAEVYSPTIPLLCADSSVVWPFSGGSRHPDRTVSYLYAAVLLPVAWHFLALVLELLASVPRLERTPILPTIFTGIPRVISAPSHLGLALLSACLSLLMIVATEKTIAANDAAEGEIGWGFGQIVAILLVVTPVWEALRTGWDVIALWMDSHPEQDIELAPAADS